MTPLILLPNSLQLLKVVRYAEVMLAQVLLGSLAKRLGTLRRINPAQAYPEQLVAGCKRLHGVAVGYAVRRGAESHLFGTKREHGGLAGVVLATYFLGFSHMKAIRCLVNSRDRTEIVSPFRFAGQHQAVPLNRQWIAAFRLVGIEPEGVGFPVKRNDSSNQRSST